MKGVSMITFRLFRDSDKQKISEFLGYFDTKKEEVNSSRKVIWDCFSKHPCFSMFMPEKIGIWESDHEIIGVVRLESPCYGDVIMDVNPYYTEIFEDMIHYAEDTFVGEDDQGNKYLNIHIRESDQLQVNLESKGYSIITEGRMLAISILDPIANGEIPKSFRIKSLKEIYNFNKLNNMLWKAFNYKGAPPAFDDDVYLPFKHAWLDYDRDLCSVIEAPDSSYASFCGMWFDDYTKSAFIEPLATAVIYRNLGLARACIVESIRKCQVKGARIVFVEPDHRALEWYKKIGFKPAYKSYCWNKSGL
jgi:GNAT superfamily N-acetyltransferase